MDNISIINNIEDEIFGETQQPKPSINEELEDNSDFIEEQNKLEIVNTNIVCDGSGFQDMINDNKSGPPPNFSKYKFNNFRVTDNEYLIKLENAGGALIISDDGELMLRSSPDADFKKVTPDKASIVISKLIGEYVVVGRGSKDRAPDIKYEDLMLVSAIDMDTNVMSEFHEDGNTHKWNKFKPSKPLILDKNTPYKKPTYSMKLIAHLVNYNEKRFHYIINWLAYMFVFSRLRT